MANQVSFKVLFISFSKTCNSVALSCVHCKLLGYTTCALVSCVISSGQGHCVVFLVKTLDSHSASLHHVKK